MGLGAKKDEKPIETPPSSARAESVVTKTLSPSLLATVVLEGKLFLEFKNILFMYHM